MEKEAYKGYSVDGDLEIQHDIHIGGKFNAQGKSHFKGSVRIDGTLHANNINSAFKGLFPTEEDLNESYPLPCKGWWALVGDDIPAPVYRESNGIWTATGGTGGSFEIEGSNVDLTEIEDAIDELQETKQDIETVIVYDETELPDLVNILVNHRIIVKNPIERDFVLLVRGNSCFDFMTGNSIPIIAFMPANIQWIKPLELKPNKRYLILFDRAIQEEPYYNTNIVGMWTEVE